MATKEEELTAAGAEAEENPRSEPTTPTKESLKKPVSGLDSEEDVEPISQENYKELKTMISGKKNCVCVSVEN